MIWLASTVWISLPSMARWTFMGVCARVARCSIVDFLPYLARLGCAVIRFSNHRFLGYSLFDSLLCASRTRGGNVWIGSTPLRAGGQVFLHGMEVVPVDLP
jgi:hypothetical protein